MSLALYSVRFKLKIDSRNSAKDNEKDVNIMKSFYLVIYQFASTVHFLL